MIRGEGVPVSTDDSTATTWKQTLIGPCLTIVFLAGGGWVTLDAVAQESEELTDRIETVEQKVSGQQVIEVKVEAVEKRLERLENSIEKLIEIQQQQAVNTARICAATGANCR
jgi:TolA-binding protein